MNAPASISALQACLESLQKEAKRQELPLAATLIGAASEALSEEAASKTPSIESLIQQHA